PRAAGGPSRSIRESKPQHGCQPLLCFDERPCFLIADVGALLPLSPGKAKRYHYEYKKNGSCCVFLAFAPHTGFRYVEVRERRTAQDYAAFMQTLLTRYYPQAVSVRLIQGGSSGGRLLSNYRLTRSLGHARGNRASGIERLTTGSQIGQDIALLLLTTGQDCQEVRHKATAALTLRAIADFAPLHRVPQLPFRPPHAYEGPQRGLAGQ